MKSAPSSAANPSESLAGRVGRYRWKICALLFFATTINYMDRQVLGLLAPELQKSIGWNEAQYGYIVTAFQAAYALSLLGAGKLIDRVGTRTGYSIAIVVWSLASMAHSLARSAFHFGLARIALGIGEAGNFPAAIKTVAEWFPKRERALAIGIFNSGSNVGAIIAPLTVPLIALHFGWRWTFIFTGALDLVWLIFWLALYRPPNENAKLSRNEREYIQSDPQEPATKIAWAGLLPRRQTIAFAAGKFLTDPIWWFYLYWLPKFLHAQYGLSLDKIGLPLVVIYLSADVGSIGGGWLSSALIRRGWTLNAARKTTMLICALCVTPIVFASRASEVWVAVGLISLATAAHQGWSANLFASASDMFPQRAVGSVVGIGGFAGAIGGMLLAAAAGNILQVTGSYLSLFILAGSAYVLALLIIHVVAPRMAPADMADAA
ncbi:MAG TPA: MFS transporter [Bryobacteraceae bacterium]|nr:MFS transporter [Bryobacteraceae bacterium]